MPFGGAGPSLVTRFSIPGLHIHCDAVTNLSEKCINKLTDITNYHPDKILVLHDQSYKILKAPNGFYNLSIPSDVSAGT